ncbi:DinB family protein [Flavobacterium filum]|uniref:DinB family protein n=1 Tax=Flavobacterium filum TaxID=370974 RepID=UPI0023F439BB|nr:DinB family protein [Flavobacterium filum]
MTLTTLTSEAKAILLELATTLEELTMDEYTERIALLGNASLGEHTRHIIELFQQLNDGYASGIVDYDNRKRDKRLQENIDFALETLAIIISGLCKVDKELYLTTLYNHQENQVKSNYGRELMYNIEHCIHHQAIIKIGLLSLGKEPNNDTFGYAKSTIVYKQQCAQ